MAGGWADWVEGWAVAFLPDDAAMTPFTPAWWTVRAGRGRALALASPALPLPGRRPRAVTVKVVDRLGRETLWRAGFDDPARA